MIFVDSGVWIDFYAKVDTPGTRRLRGLLADKGAQLIVGDLVIAEVLQGVRDRAAAAKIDSDFRKLQRVTVSDPDLAVQAARNYRHLRDQGITVRKTIDVLIATRCIRDGYRLLHRARDFDPFVTHLGLQLAG